MKRSMKFAGVMLIVFGILVLGISQYMSQDERGRTTEMASGAMAAVAGAAARLTADNAEYTIVVANRVGMGRVSAMSEAPVAVQAVLAVRGGNNLARVCATLPRVRDAINGVITDRIGPKLRAGGKLVGDELAAEGELLRVALNRLVDGGDAFAGARIVLRNAFDVKETGCNEATKTANVNNGAAAPPARH